MPSHTTSSAVMRTARNKELVLENGDIIRFDNIICSPFSQTLMFAVELNAHALSYEVRADATDYLGGAYRFEFSDDFTGAVYTSGRAVNASPDGFNADAQTIALNIMVFDEWGEVTLFEAADVKDN